MFIFPAKYEEIAVFISRDVYRGVTVFDGVGWYSKEQIKIGMSIVRKKEISAIYGKIKEIDPYAFISIESVMGVYGQGFEKLKL